MTPDLAIAIWFVGSIALALLLGHWGGGDMTKPSKPWKRAECIAAQCRAGKKLCRYNRQLETGATEVVFFLEPGGRAVGRKSAENAINHGLLIPSSDGLFGAEFAQTWSAA